MLPYANKTQLCAWLLQVSSFPCSHLITPVSQAVIHVLSGIRITCCLCESSRTQIILIDIFLIWQFQLNTTLQAGCCFRQHTGDLSSPCQQAKKQCCNTSARHPIHETICSLLTGTSGSSGTSRSYPECSCCSMQSALGYHPALVHNTPARNSCVWSAGILPQVCCSLRIGRYSSSTSALKVSRADPCISPTVTSDSSDFSLIPFGLMRTKNRHFPDSRSPCIVCRRLLARSNMRCHSFKTLWHVNLVGQPSAQFALL